MTLYPQETELWWDAPPEEGYKRLNIYIDNILQANQRRFTDYVRFAALYGNWETAQMTQAFLAQRNVGSGRQFKRLSFNICQSMTDTVVNQRASEAPDLMAMSADGDYKQFVRARLLTRALKGELQANNHDQTFPRVVQNACMFGNGYTTVERGDGELKIQRVFSPEILIDPYDNTVDGWPYCFNHARYVNKHKLIAKYPDLKPQIIAAASLPNNYLRTKHDENVRVVESWTMAAGGRPGKHICAIATANLVALEDYPYESPPFVSLPWGFPLQGWYSSGLIDQLVGLQMEISDTLEIIHEAIRLFSHPFMLVENGSNVNLAHIQDVPGRILKYTNQKPEIVAPNLLSAEVYQHLERCYQKAYEIAGINMYAAQAKTMARYESSKAMRAATEMGEVRHFSFAKACERYHTDLAHLVCREAAILSEEGDYKTRMPHSEFFQHIPWKEIAYDVDNFKIDVDTINKSNDSMAGKIQDLEDLAQLQQLSVPELRRYLLNPDIKRVLSHITASDEYIDYVLYKLAYEEEYVPPNQFMDLNAAFKAAVSEYLTAIRIGCTPKAQENLLNYILAIRGELKDVQQEQMDMQAQAQMKAQATLQPQAPVSTAPGSQQ